MHHCNNPQGLILLVQMAKYEVDRFESPPDPDLVCCICQCVLDKPLQSPCQHVFCKVCIETWLTNRKNCPNCRKSLRISKLKPVIPIVRNMINRLIIRCDNYSHGCIEGVKLEY
ncbi:putative dentin sialophosphoprotein [Apostichopus japonicus]|uniref:Putative dentin sialophosphoprotein n=1 Tax=Stichopus japonicus TaxID=307972 RepID=A0A2G8JZC1_STIJA|nr:putative dentin sialophosphoprotein [Apostichopus japonicus]